MKLLLLTLGFIIMTQIGMVFTELVRINVAEELGYEGEYISGWGRFFFWNEKIYNEYNAIKEEYNNNPEIYRKSARCETLRLKDEKNHALIELSGKLFTLLISLIGITMFLYRKSKIMTWKEWIWILLGLFFMKDVSIHSFDVWRGGYLCDESTLWLYFNLPVLKSMTVFVIIGYIFLIYIIYKIPKASRFTFVVSGFIGSIVGALIWLLYIGRML